MVILVCAAKLQLFFDICKLFNKKNHFLWLFCCKSKISKIVIYLFSIHSRSHVIYIMDVTIRRLPDYKAYLVCGLICSSQFQSVTICHDLATFCFWPLLYFCGSMFYTFSSDFYGRFHTFSNE